MIVVIIYSQIYSLKSMFDSPQFKESLDSFQKLLAEGVFDLSFPVVKNEGCRTLKKLALCSVTKSDWVEKYDQLQVRIITKRKYPFCQNRIF